MFTTADLKASIKEKGIENIRFIAPFKTEGTLTPLGLMVGSNNKTEKVECKITEKRYRVKDNYKISLIPVKDPLYIEHYYLLDLTSLIDRGIITIVG